MSSKPPTNSPPSSISELYPPTRCGYVALVGRPNAGKSTLFNTFLGQRLSIVTPRPQTTRSRILGILTRPSSQIIFLDTPGLLQPQYKLHETMEHQIDQATRQADLVLLLIDGTRPRDRVKLVHSFLEQWKKPLIAVLNKTDLLDSKQIQPQIKILSREFGLEQLLPLSALQGDNVAPLLDLLEERLPFGPYAISITIEEFKERADKTYINAIIHVERDSQKGIVIGRKGSRLHAIGRQARLQIEELLEASVYLDLWVKVRPDWRKKDRDLRDFGYI